MTPAQYRRLNRIRARERECARPLVHPFALPIAALVLVLAFAAMTALVVGGL